MSVLATKKSSGGPGRPQPKVVLDAVDEEGIFPVMLGTLTVGMNAMGACFKLVIKIILYREDVCLLELVRYIRVNPLWVNLVEN